METKIELCKQYFAMHKAIAVATQINERVDLNTKMYKFRQKHNFVLRGNEPLIEVFIGEGIDSEFVGQIVFKYGKKDKNLECKRIGYDYTLVNN